MKKQIAVTTTILANIILLVFFVTSDGTSDIYDYGIEDSSEVRVLGEFDETESVVERVIDGDTIELSSGEKVRYIGVDTPELSRSGEATECFAEDARIYNEELVLGQTVRLEKDVSETDRYGRLLRYVYVDLDDGEYLVNDALVRGGYAYASTYPPDVAYDEVFRESQDYAEKEGLGLWSECEYFEPDGTNTESYDQDFTLWESILSFLFQLFE